MKNLSHRITGEPDNDAESSPVETSSGPGFFATQFESRDGAEDAAATWATRARQVRAEACERQRGVDIFIRLWREDRHFAALNVDDLARMGDYLDFVLVAANQEVISQNEQGDYLIIVLDGTLAVDRVQPWGGRARLAEAHVGDVLGEMSLLDAGARFSACTTLTPTVLAVLDARHLDDMVSRDPRLAIALLASLSRRLSLRLRQVSARLSALLSRS